MRMTRALTKSPATAERHRDGVGRASPAGHLHALARVAGQSAAVQRQQGFQQMADAAGSPGGHVLQGVLYTNPLFEPDTTTLPEFQALDNKVTTAQTNARKAVTETRDQSDTKKEALYKRKQDAKTWGYVVEEHFDTEAISLGWGTQTKLTNGRPDYSKQVGDVTLYADLTTLGQSGDGGPHVGGKLATQYHLLTNEGATPQWHAGDIVHDGAQPGQQPAAFVPNGTCTDEHRHWFAQFRAAGEDGPYDPWREGMKEYYNEKLSHGTFYTEFDEDDRDEFVLTAQEVSARVAADEKRSAKKRRRSTDYDRRAKKRQHISYAD